MLMNMERVYWTFLCWFVVYSGVIGEQVEEIDIADGSQTDLDLISNSNSSTDTTDYTDIPDLYTTEEPDTTNTNSDITSNSTTPAHMTTTEEPDNGWLVVTTNETHSTSTNIQWKIVDSNLNITRFSIILALEHVNWNYIINKCSFYYMNRTLIENRSNVTFHSLIPHSTYTAMVYGSDVNGSYIHGKTKLSTRRSAPDNVERLNFSVLEDITPENYSVRVHIKFGEPCFMNDDLKKYQVIIHDINHNQTMIKDTNETEFDFYAKPNNIYTMGVKTITAYFENSSDIMSYRSPYAVPSTPSMNQIPINVGDGSASVTLSKKSFKSENISYFAIILSDQNVTGGEYSRWNSTEWPRPWSNYSSFYYQMTPDFFDPFEDNQDEFKFEVGDGRCGNTSCKNAVETDKIYFLIVRVFNPNYYYNSMPMKIYFGSDSRLGLILGLTLGLAVLAAISILGFLLWKKRIPGFIKLYRRSLSRKAYRQVSTKISYKNVPNYVETLDRNPNMYTEQYRQLEEKTADIITVHTTNAATLLENRRKNRYINILPFDSTRVKLSLDEDDEVNNDYINASYIEGYSGKIEYIATQGPLKTTCSAFWRMILQENVKIIVMVAQFVENNREKVYRYFPDYQSTMGYDDITIECISEDEFESFCVRNVMVRKDDICVSCIHLQYLQWPDFDVPADTQSILQFCCQMRPSFDTGGGPIVVHCSAGVGRTGTIIATDILLQQIRAKKDIDIFNTILDLRRQRINMVQTQSQYIYIHRLLRDWILYPPANVTLDHASAAQENVAPSHMDRHI